MQLLGNIVTGNKTTFYFQLSTKFYATKRTNFIR
jgi:hypothetical protein